MREHCVSPTHLHTRPGAEQRGGGVGLNLPQTCGRAHLGKEDDVQILTNKQINSEWEERARLHFHLAYNNKIGSKYHTQHKERIRNVCPGPFLWSIVFGALYLSCVRINDLTESDTMRRAKSKHTHATYIAIMTSPMFLRGDKTQVDYESWWYALHDSFS